MIIEKLEDSSDLPKMLDYVLILQHCYMLCPRPYYEDLYQVIDKSILDGQILKRKKAKINSKHISDICFIYSMFLGHYKIRCPEVANYLIAIGITSLDDTPS